MDTFWPAATAVAIGLAVAGLVFVAVRFGAGAEPEGALRSRLGERGLRIIQMTLVALASIVALVLFSRASGFPFDRVAWTGLGALLIGATLLRPAWFWEHPKARWLRGLAGDSATIVLYLVVGALLVLTGLFTNIPFGRGR